MTERDYFIQVSANVKASTRNEIDAIARKLKKPRSFIVRRALEEYLKKENSDK